MKTNNELNASLKTITKDALDSIMELMKSHKDTSISLIEDDNKVCTFAIDDSSYEIYLTKLSITNDGQGFDLIGMDADGYAYNTANGDNIDTPVSMWVDVLGAVERYYENK